MNSKDGSYAIIKTLEKNNSGKHQIHFRLRDWSVSRQRYWGAPIPIVNCPQCGAVGETNLPVVLPEKVSFEGVTSPLKNMPEFLHTTCPRCGGAAERETDTFDTFFESSWYYARFACKKQDNAMLDGRVNYWVPVDQYIGGIEHAVMHLLYSRFIHKLMRDEGLLNSDEPFTRLLTQGMVLNQGTKMSKSKGNTVDPGALIDRYGTDTVRLFSMFAAPPEQSLEWSDSGVEGSHRFLKRLWALAYEYRDLIKAEQKTKHDAAAIDWDNTDSEQRNTLRQIYDILEQAKYDYDRLQFNTVVSGCMKLLNLLAKIPGSENSRSRYQAFCFAYRHEFYNTLLSAYRTPYHSSIVARLRLRGVLSLTRPGPKPARLYSKSTRSKWSCKSMENYAAVSKHLPTQNLNTSKKSPWMTPKYKAPLQIK